MSIAELKRIVDEISPEERQFLRLYLAEKYPERDTLHTDKFDGIMREMDEGKKVPWDEVVKEHERLKARGL